MEMQKSGECMEGRQEWLKGENEAQLKGEADKQEQQKEREDQLYGQEEEIEKQRRQLNEEEDQVKEMKERVWKDVEQIAERKRQLKEKQDQLKERENLLLHDNEHITKLKGHIMENENQLAEEEKQVCKNEEQIREMKTQLKNYSDKLKEKSTSLRRKKELRTCLKKQQDDLKTLEDQQSRDKERIKELGMLLKKEKDELKTKEHQLSRDNEQIKELRMHLEKEEDEMKTLNDQLKRDEKHLQDWRTWLTKESDQLERRLEILKQQNEIKLQHEGEKIKYEKLKQDQALHIERNRDILTKQEEKLQMLKKEIKEMKKQTQKEKQQMLMEKQWIEEEGEALKKQLSVIEKQKENIQRQEVANKEKKGKLESEKIQNENEIKAQRVIICKLKEEMKECEEIIRRQNNIKDTNKRDIEKQIKELEDQRAKIDTHKTEIAKQKNEILTNAKEIRQARGKKQTLTNITASKEREQQIKLEAFQKQIRSLEKQKDLHEQNVTLARFKAKHSKYSEKRRREEDLHILQNIRIQLGNRHPTSELDLTNELGKIVEKQEVELQRILEEIEIWEKTHEQTGRGKEKDNTKKCKEDDATLDATSTSHEKAGKPSLQRTFFKKQEDHSDSFQDTIRNSTLTRLTDFLQSLSLDCFFPNKLTSEEFFLIGSTAEKQTDSNLACRFMQKLLMLNYRMRLITQDNNDPIGLEIQQPTNSDDFFNELTDFHTTVETEKINPMDVQMAIFHCADNFLRQKMVNKLSSCQYALPMLVPSPLTTEIEFPLWTFRQIRKTWRLDSSSNKHVPVCQVKSPMVFFCRLGSVSTSKSQLLNSLINPRHDTFFHRDSPGSSKNCMLINGLVEVSWYCPAGNTDDHFHDITAFCNLHGDALDHRKQTDFLAQRATAIVVLMQNMKPSDKEREFLHMLHKSPKPLICLVSDLQKCPLKIGQGLNVKIGLRGRNRDNLDNEIKHAIKVCLQKCNYSHTFSLEKSSKLAKRSGFRVDENIGNCQEMKNRALKIIKLLEGETPYLIKDKFLPCQGKLWHEWTKMNRELHRLHGEKEHTRDDLLTEMNKIRDKQRGVSLRFMKCFVENLQSDRIMQTQYFVGWVQNLIDGKFSEHVSQLRLKYNNKWLEVQKSKNTNGKTNELKAKQEELEKVSEELDSVTLGLEHFFREMAQIYEAWSTVPEEMGADVSAFPSVAADLLISGQPLELMDGDTAHVPLKWTESVLDKVTEKLGDQRVFVLSVLGLQSSGKSTLLNVMFGLQFAVSAGRCTRGAFMQLIRVKEEVKEELNFDFLLIIDTEGLQALELAGKSTFSHDNELATFVICIANMTLINIFGENPAEIQEILQIVIQAILRMKKAHFKPSCMFVHQNITDLTAAQKNTEVRRKLQQQMDEITISVAKEEGCQVKFFNDVIKCNFHKDVHYIAQLWKGNLPMAPPNPLYSENAERLKQVVLKAAAQEKALRLSEFKIHVKEVWNSVLNEDFIFSFRNSLELALHRKKCTQTLKIVC